jgi:hypothetical protein
MANHSSCRSSDGRRAFARGGARCRCLPASGSGRGAPMEHKGLRRVAHRSPLACGAAQGGHHRFPGTEETLRDTGPVTNRGRCVPSAPSRAAPLAHLKQIPVRILKPRGVAPRELE